MFEPKEIEQSKEQEVIFSLGSKNLILTFHSEKSRATSYIERVGSIKDREEHETRILYGQAKSYLQDRANESNTPIFYSFTTRNKKLIAWAKKIGKEIFNWDESDITLKGSNQHMFESTIYPENKSEIIH
ncbi:MAG: hypothetical protein CO029_00305 [Candidatus Magasanikbacteria bacterium CG_4_9_14_0_2_um_filter_41_10]|nr:MAG: hypothetical protein CO029_00305 [Candidatus Magasanikbacteria bacterium CG_4_9_14_0_2_um_filter_41_10]